MVYALFVLTVFCSSLIQTVSGFGFGIVAVSLFPYYMPSTNLGVTLAGILATGTNTGSILHHRKLLRLKLILPMLGGYFVTSALVIRFLSTRGEGLMRILLGIALILLSLYLFFQGNRVRIRPAVWKGILFGALSGVTGGLFSIAGPPVVAYMLSATDSPESYNGNIQMFFCITNLYSLAMRIANGLVGTECLIFVVLGILPVLGGIFLGQRIADRLSAKVIRRVVYAVMLTSGVILLF